MKKKWLLYVIRKEDNFDHLSMITDDLEEIYDFISVITNINADAYSFKIERREYYDE